MYQRQLLDFSHNKYRLAMFFLLAGATIFSVAIWRLRSEFTGTSRYGFLIWNLFLAWIPFLISYFTYTITLKRKQIYIVIPMATFLWLIFLPNAPYILTDFQHLAVPAHNLPIWYDVMMLIWFSFTGLLLGITSLFLMQEIVRHEFGHWLGWAFVAIVATLSGFGVYFGRFLHWNSWDLFSNSQEMALYTFKKVQDPSMQSAIFITLFTTFFLFLYVTLYTFGNLLQERNVNDSREEESI